MTGAERELLRRLIDERARLRSCECGCGRTFALTTERRRYFERACANRHWHVKRRAWA